MKTFGTRPTSQTWPARSGARRLLWQSAGLAFFAGLALGVSALPASAQSSPFGWEEGCAQRIVSPGSGDALRVFNCSRQKDCQQLANARGRVINEAGCFFVSPSAPTVPASAVRSNPQRQQ